MAAAAAAGMVGSLLEEVEGVVVSLIGEMIGFPIDLVEEEVAVVRDGERRDYYVIRVVTVATEAIMKKTSFYTGPCLMMILLLAQ